MGDHGHEAVALRLRAQANAVATLARRLEKAAELGMIPAGWQCAWCVETAAAEIRSALEKPPEQTSSPFPRARRSRDDVTRPTPTPGDRT